MLHLYVMVECSIPNSFHSSTDRLLSEPELSTAESPLADKKAPGSERAAERAAAAQQNNERARLAPRPSYVNMQVMIKKKKKTSHPNVGCLSWGMGNSVSF